MNLAETILEQVRQEIPSLPRAPILATVLVGGDDRDRRYIGFKETACRRVGMEWQGVFLSEATSQEQLDAACQLDVDGIFVQLPLPAGLVVPRIPPSQDIDGLVHPDYPPCTAAGALRVLRAHGVPLTSFTVRGDQHYAAADIGRLLTLHGAVPGEDVIVLATGRPVEAASLPAGAAVVDLTGDLVGAHPGMVIPPRGVLGPLTVALLLENTLKAAQLRLRSS